MDDDLEAVRRTARRFAAAERARNAARTAHLAAVLTALRDGQPPTVIARLSPFTSAHLRKIAREDGIPPARRGRKASPRGQDPRP